MTASLILLAVAISAALALLMMTTQAIAFQIKMTPEEQKGFDRFIQDWKKVCPDGNNSSEFCTGYLTGASIQSSGPG